MGFTYSPTYAAGLHDRGIESTLDIHPQDAGARLDQRTGVLMIDGWPHVPWTPTRLHKITRPPRFTIAKLDDDATLDERREHKTQRRALARFHERIAERGKYALSPNGRAKSDGRRHFFTSRHDAHLATAAHRKSKVFTQATITIDAGVAPKLRQRLRWGSPEWIQEYAPRSAVEATYGNLKSPDGENMRRGWIRLFGLVRTGLMLAFAAAHHNLRVARRWAERTGAATADLLLAADPPDLGFEERTVDDLVAAAQASPLAA